jgi:hypothetical protein
MNPPKSTVASKETVSALLGAVVPASDGLKPLYTDEKGAAQITGYSPAFFRKRRFRGDGPPYRKVGRSVKYNIIEPLRWMEEQTMPRNELPSSDPRNLRGGPRNSPRRKRAI